MVIFTRRQTRRRHDMIFGPGWVRLLFVVQVVFWVELQALRRLSLFFVKFWVPVKGAQQCGIGLPNIHKFSAG